MMQRFHDWEMLACKQGLHEVSAWVREEVFTCQPFKLTFLFKEFYRMFHLERLYITKEQL